MPIYKQKGKNKDGLNKYMVRINYTENGKYKTITRTAYGREAAKNLEALLLHSEKHNDSITISELIDLYKEYKKHEVRESTLKKSMQILNKYVRPLDLKLSALNAQTLAEWKNDVNSTDISFTMKKNVYGAFRGLLNWAVTMEYMGKNPLIKIGNFRNAYQEKSKIDFYAPEEFKKFIREVKAISDEKGMNDYYVFFGIAYFTGLRKGEIHALRWSDYHDGKFFVTKSISQKLGNGDRETPPKNMSSNRAVEVPIPLQEILSEHLAICQHFKGFKVSFHICGGVKPLRDTSIENVNRKASKRARIKHIRIHDFRHSHASFLANNGINILEISRRLGHANITQTLNTYSHFYPAEEEKATSILNQIRI